jgi:uncharacterized Rmd1/YagE family protein
MVVLLFLLQKRMMKYRRRRGIVGLLLLPCLLPQGRGFERGDNDDKANCKFSGDGTDTMTLSNLQRISSDAFGLLIALLLVVLFTVVKGLRNEQGYCTTSSSNKNNNVEGRRLSFFHFGVIVVWWSVRLKRLSQEIPGTSQVDPRILMGIGVIRT